ncbi:MAG TPA: ferritin [Candidatus Kapabacteria bacterium]|jgi:ferritin|nr:ferritin [Candidatus Kapabacteria bacterium]HOM04099.1 ferritin [Candidatus Kapabacteria bacterium]HPP39264.1 ferritin [Candidatus Kapabacteria bacterium]
MIKKVIEDAINQQIVREMYSSNLYLAMSAYFASINLNGFSNWMHVQAEEEMMHALKFFDYLIDRGGKVKIGQIAAPPSEWESPLAAFEDALRHEQLVTGWINELADLAFNEKDHATSSMLQWFIDEQVEEEATTGEIVERLKLIGDSKGALFFLDNELKQRKSEPKQPGE